MNKTGNVKFAAARVLWIPVSGGAGVGEYERCLMLARALGARRPDIKQRFVIAARAPYATRVPFDTVRVPDSTTRANAEVVAAIAEFAPYLVVFDGGGRVRQLVAARAQGARTLVIASRESAVRRSLGLRRARRIDRLIAIGTDARRAVQAPFARALRRLFGVPTPLLLDSVFEPALPMRAVLERHGLERDRFVLLCAGGGAEPLAGATSGAVYAEVAAQLADRGEERVVCVGRAPNRSARVRALDWVPNGELMTLIEAARLSILAGGSLLTQAVTLGAPVVAAALKPEQQARVAALAAAGAIVRAEPDRTALTARAVALLDDANARAALTRNAHALGWRNGLDALLEALEALLT
jgi:hypothetical protein